MRVASPILPHLKDKNDETEVRKLAIDITAMINRANDGKFGNTSTGDYAEFEGDGFLGFHGSSVAWKDIIVPAVNLRTGSTPPTFAAFINGIFGFRFNSGANDELHGAFEMQHDYSEGSDLDFHIHWSPTTTNTGNIIWGVEYTYAAIGNVFPASITVSQTIKAPGIANKHMLHDIVTIPGYGLKIGSITAYRVFRSGTTDTFTGNAFLHSVGVHYEVNTLGSRTELTK